MMRSCEPLLALGLGPSCLLESSWLLVALVVATIYYIYYLLYDLGAAICYMFNARCSALALGLCLCLCSCAHTLHTTHAHVPLALGVP